MTLKEFANLPYTCSRPLRVNGECMFGGDCRKYIVFYKAECRDCKMRYVGSTQQTLKTHIASHLGEVSKLVNIGHTSNSFTKHFAHHHHQKSNKYKRLTVGEVRKNVKVVLLLMVTVCTFVLIFNTRATAFLRKKYLIYISY